MKRRKEEELQEKTSVDLLIEQRKKAYFRRQLKKQKKILFRVSLLLATLVLIGYYLLSDLSLVKQIQIDGLTYLTKDQVLAQSTITYQSRYPFVLAANVEKALLQNPLIENVKVTHQDFGGIRIVVTERVPIGYRYIEQAEILFTDGTVAPMDETMTALVARIPLITGFLESEQLADLAKAFKNVQPRMISQISEINQYAISYDPNMIRLTMQDGHQFFSSYYSLDVINQYHDIVSALKKQNACIYVDEMTKTAYTQLCPGEEAPVNEEPEPNPDQENTEN